MCCCLHEPLRRWLLKPHHRWPSQQRRQSATWRSAILLIEKSARSKWESWQSVMSPDHGDKNSGANSWSIRRVRALETDENSWISCGHYQAGSSPPPPATLTPGPRGDIDLHLAQAVESPHRVINIIKGDKKMHLMNNFWLTGSSQARAAELNL